MYTKIIKSLGIIPYLDWIRENNYSLKSPKHRGKYAEMAFLRYCKEQNIIPIRIDSMLQISEQIPLHFLSKKQQKELEKIKLKLDYFCIENNKGYFVDCRMGMSAAFAGKELMENDVFLFRVFEDGEIFIKKIR